MYNIQQIECTCIHYFFNIRGYLNLVLGQDGPLEYIEIIYYVVTFVTLKVCPKNSFLQPMEFPEKLICAYLCHTLNHYTS